MRVAMPDHDATPPSGRAATWPGDSMPERILDAAAAMFVSKGFAGTSTREIAQTVGIKQASLYYYFPNKRQILENLLYRSLLPTLACAQLLDDLEVGPREKFAILTMFDIHLLFRFRHNIGNLYTLPEVRTEQFAGFAKDKALLASHYARVVRDVEELNPEPREPALVLNIIYAIVESATTARNDLSVELTDSMTPVLVESCLRVMRTPESEIERLVQIGEFHSARLAQEIPQQQG